MTDLEAVNLVKMYIDMYSDGWKVGVDRLYDILSDIENGCTFKEIEEHYDLM